jgi:hypothetical protein
MALPVTSRTSLHSSLTLRVGTLLFCTADIRNYFVCRLSYTLQRIERMYVLKTFAVFCLEYQPRTGYIIDNFIYLFS